MLRVVFSQSEHQDRVKAISAIFMGAEEQWDGLPRGRQPSGLTARSRPKRRHLRSPFGTRWRSTRASWQLLDAVCSTQRVLSALVPSFNTFASFGVAHSGSAHPHLHLQPSRLVVHVSQHGMRSEPACNDRTCTSYVSKASPPGADP